VRQVDRCGDDEAFLHPNNLWDDDSPTGVAACPIDRDEVADVVVVGAGFTGMWCAYEIARRDPSRRILVLEGSHVGFGASGRNGGWCSATPPRGLDEIDAAMGSGAGRAIVNSLVAALDRIVTVCDTEGIDAHIRHGGWVQLARNGPQAARIRDDIAVARRHGFGEDHLVWLDRRATTERVNATNVSGAGYTPHCLAVHPGRLVRGLAMACRGRGIGIRENTQVVGIAPRRVTTSTGHTVSARHIIVATEAYTHRLPGHERSILPVYSLMIATEPLAPSVLRQIGLEQGETFNDARHLVIYGQRTVDGRIAFGGRGAPYHFASSTRSANDVDPRVAARLRATLVELFPVLDRIAITHHWGGPLGISRDWFPFVDVDDDAGVITIGGYVGDGVAMAHVAASCAADAVTDASMPRLPIVRSVPRRWEVEPFRFLGVNAALRAVARLDAAESRGRSARLSRSIVRRITR
jgi:glycine/D-amino acid oxidase-like deaminating enzyme